MLACGSAQGHCCTAHPTPAAAAASAGAAVGCCRCCAHGACATVQADGGLRQVSKVCGGEGSLDVGQRAPPLAQLARHRCKVGLSFWRVVPAGGSR
jgi:hypothetical protein